MPDSCWLISNRLDSKLDQSVCLAILDQNLKEQKFWWQCKRNDTNWCSNIFSGLTKFLQRKQHDKNAILIIQLWLRHNVCLYNSLYHSYIKKSTCFHIRLFENSPWNLMYLQNGEQCIGTFSAEMLHKTNRKTSSFLVFTVLFFFIFYFLAKNNTLYLNTK